MNIPEKTLTILRKGGIVGAELSAPREDFRAFVLVIPQVPNPQDNPDGWIHWGHCPFPHEGGVISVKDVSFISGYEIRYLEHNTKYTDEKWGMDYDYVLDDLTTRVKRAFIKNEDEIEAMLTSWLHDLSQLRDVDDFDSSLVNNHIDSYLNRPDEHPHLWL